MDAKIERLVSWANGKEQPPIGIELAPTLRCNVNCKFCWRRKDSFDKTSNQLKSREMSKDRYLKLIDEAANLGVEEVKIIGGGESLYRNDTFEVMKKIKKKQMYGYLCTNGSLLDAEKISELDEVGWDYIKFSLHGLKDTHNELTNSKIFDKVVENIKLLDSTDIEVEIGMVVVNENYKQVPELLNLAHDLGVDNFFLEPITVYSDIGEKLTLSDDDNKKLMKILDKTMDKAEKYSIQSNFNEFIDDNLVESTNDMVSHILDDIDKDNDSFANLPCYEPFLRMGIRVDGRVAPCGFYDQERGDSVKNKSLEDVWYGDYFKERRREQLNKQLPEYCSKCCTTLVEKQKRIRKILSEVV